MFAFIYGSTYNYIIGIHGSTTYLLSEALLVKTASPDCLLFQIGVFTASVLGQMSNSWIPVPNLIRIRIPQQPWGFTWTPNLCASTYFSLKQIILFALPVSQDCFDNEMKVFCKPSCPYQCTILLLTRKRTQSYTDIKIYIQ